MVDDDEDEACAPEEPEDKGVAMGGKALAGEREEEEEKEGRQVDPLGQGAS